MSEQREYARGGRFPLLSPAQLDDRQRAVHDAVAGPPRADGPFLIADDDGHLAGPFNAMLYSPAIGHALQALGSALRFGGSLADRTRELVICAVAAALDSDYEWYSHSRVAAAAGVSKEELHSLARSELPGTISPAEEAALRLAEAVLAGNRVDDDVHAEALRHHGHAGITELSVLVGYYQTLAGLLAAGDVPAPSDQR
ncbi:carboxymuconolactone decarboxylase family protein [Arthrobacter castelli]|uniref:carboxymuconolactone decarboxylase family protein n=1 Tax=Arthrobacter castelli TaxID=271431 RepID=UPI001FDFB4F9|nr:carboxymuconolactone decarboxylase family protein [Arthrobacter castelli]